MDDFLNEVIELLKQDERFFTEDGEFLRNAVYEAAMKMDTSLIKLLFSNPTTKERFFKDIDGISVFDKIAFGWLINNRQFFQNSYTRYKNKIGLINNRGDFLSTSNDVELVFPYKDCVLEGGQTKDDQKRDEIFYNETLAPEEVDRLLYPKVLTKAKKFTIEGVELVTEVNDKDNFIIKGNNLLALASLLKRYEGKINCIYIDPPFNTGNDSFNYNDKFTRSTWLTFMKNRLTLAKRLLSRDGNIFIHIDINHSHYLKVLCDEIFEEANFVEEIIWAYGSPSGGRATTPKPVNIHDYILHYCKDYSNRKQLRVYTPYNEKYISDWFKYTDDNGRIYQKRQRGKDDEGNTVWEKQYLDESKGVPLSTVWTDIKQVYADPRAYKESQAKHTELIKDFSGGQKPERLIKRILELSTEEGDIVLDFHLGTGTTCAVAHKMKRQYIGIEQMDYINDFTVKRLADIIKGNNTGISNEVDWQGGGSFIYCELAELNQKYVNLIQEAHNDRELSSVWVQIKSTGFVSSYVDPRDINPEAEDFKALSFDEKKKLFIALLDKNLLYINLCDIDDEDFAISYEDKLFNKSFYKGV